MTEHVSRWSRRVVAVIMILGLAAATTSPGVTAQEAPATAVVPIAAVGVDGTSGLALLMPATSGGTDIQIIVSGAAPGTFAVVHRGTCDAIDPAPVALLGDVSTTSQVVIANAFEALADGTHVLALHQGLELATTIGCGVIPAAARVVTSPIPTQPPPSAGGSFTGTLTGFGIAWPADWTRYEVVAVEGEDRIGLSNGATSMLLAARLAPGGDPQTCVRTARQELFDRLDAGSLRDLAPVTDADGTTVSGVEADRAWLAYRYVSVAQDGEADIADHLECRRSGDVMLYILHRSSPGAYPDATAAREALLTGLTFPGSLPAPTPDRGPSAVPGGGSFTAPTLGFSISWDGRWTEIPVTGLERYEHVGLSDGASRVVVSGIHDPAWNALACARDSDADFQLRASDGRIRDLAPLTQADGSRVRGGDEVRAWIGYSYTDAETGGAVAEYHECRAANEVVVRIQHRSLPDLYDQGALARDELLRGLTLPSAPPAPPPATPNAACEGYATWHAATLARVDALTALKAEADDAAIAYDEPRYVAALVKAARDLQRMRGEQEGDPVPPAAREANGLAATTFESYASAARLLAEYYQSSTTTATLQRAARAQRAAEQVEAQFNVALSDVEATCG